MMSIPEGATHKLTVFSKTKIENQIVDYFKRTDDGEWVCFNSRQNRWYLSFRDVEDLHSMLEPINSPQTETQSVYTKEMAEAGELPNVGMLVLFGGQKCKVYTDKDSDNSFVVMHDNEWEVVGLDDVEFIDTRTQAEKDEDETIKMMNKISEIEIEKIGMTLSARNNNKLILGEIINGKIPNLKYTGKDND